jgi:hypothetical protein
MRRPFTFPLLGCLSLAACDALPIIGDKGDGGGNSHEVTLRASWLEWPMSAAPGAPFGVRVVGYTDINIDRFHARVRIEGDTVTIEPYGFTEPCADLCRSVFDTVVQVPGIAAPTVRTIWLRAPTGLGVPPQPRRTFGPVVLTEAIPMDYTMRAAGRAKWTPRSLDCYEINPALDGSPTNRRFTSYDPPDTAIFPPFVYGRIHSTQDGSCGTVTAPVIEIDSIR